MASGTMMVAIRDAAIVSALATVLALTVNAVRSDGIALVQTKDYDILVPCPEPAGEAEQMAASDARVTDKRSLVIDARSPEEFAAWHLPDAINVEFDWLGPPPDQQVKQVAGWVASSGAHRVLVYGDGGDPDSGREWARLLSAGGIKNVFFVAGGAPALQASNGGNK